MRIERIEIDEGNVEHVTSHGITVEEIEGVFHSRPAVRRNKGGRTGDYYALANGIRVNFLYSAGTARPVSAWRMRS